MEKKRKSSEKIEIILLIVSAILFILIWINLNQPWVFLLDYLINLKVQGIENNTLSFLTEKISYIFEPINGIILLIIISAIIWIKKFRRESLFLAFVSIIGAGLIYVLKNIIMRIRPLNSIISETGFSFPSGHATMGLILFGCLIYYSVEYIKSKSLKITAMSCSIIFILLIGFSRIYLRVHWFSDVIAGFLLGMFVISLTIILQGFIESYRKEK
ncbi:MAG: phosphatase PAP2 family protein [Nanoarchaeota archaeon]